MKKEITIILETPNADLAFVKAFNEARKMMKDNPKGNEDCGIISEGTACKVNFMGKTEFYYFYVAEYPNYRVFK